MTALLLFVTLFVSAPAAQTKSPAAMTTYQMVLLKKGATPPPAAPDVQMKMQEEHLARLADLSRKRVNLLYGPILDPASPIAGIAVLDVKSSADAAQAFADDPFVKAGIMSPEVHPWSAPKDWFRAPASYDVKNPASLEQLVFGILENGPNASQDAAGAGGLREKHLVYIESLYARGTLAVAGPFGDDGPMRGVLIYRVKDVAAAMALAADDPLVKAGRVRLIAYPWMTFKGMLPQVRADSSG
jgi:uncharacterized protein YciI